MQKLTGTTEQHAEALEKFFDEKLPTIPRPDRQQFFRWLRIHQNDARPIEYGIECAAKRLKSRPFNDHLHPVVYISSVALGYKSAADGERAA